jgi:hypothetical protein
MTARIPLHILFTLDCDAVALKRAARDVPRSWELSGRAIEGYCMRLLAAGFTPTLFLAHEAVAEHGPLLEELAGRGVELALLVHPPTMELGRFQQDFGTYSADDQHQIVDFAAERFADVLGARPRSVRTGKYSASDATYKVLYDLGFRQGSISRPGWNLPRLAVRWDGALHDVHYADATSRLAAGDLPFLELPLSTDPSQRHTDGMPYELIIDAGSLEALHLPVIEARLAAMEAAETPFRALCFSSGSHVDYYTDDNIHSRTLEALIDALLALADRYELAPVTLAGAHQRFRLLHTTGSALPE